MRNGFQAAQNGHGVALATEINMNGAAYPDAAKNQRHKPDQVEQIGHSPEGFNHLIPFLLDRIVANPVFPEEASVVGKFRFHVAGVIQFYIGSVGNPTPELHQARILQVRF